MFDRQVVHVVKNIMFCLGVWGLLSSSLGAAPPPDGSAQQNAAYAVAVDSLLTSSSQADWSYEGSQALENFGYTVARAGDVNKDGWDDVIVGVPFYDNTTTDTGAAFLFLGTEDGLSTSPAWMGQCTQFDARYGMSVACAGDVNNDGYDDVLVGAYYYSNTEDKEGRVFAYYGSASGLAATADWIAESDSPYSYFGCTVACAGDVNHDGYDDVIIGAMGYDITYTAGHYGEGASFVYMGSPSGLESSAAWHCGIEQNYSYYGKSLASAGDVNGDGYDDIIVGAHYYEIDGDISFPASLEGAAFIYYGSASGLPGASITGPAEASDGGPADPDWTGLIDQHQHHLGSCVASAGDLNGDGYDDIVISGQDYDTTGGLTDAGGVFVYYGSLAGPAATPDWMAQGDRDSLKFGASVACAGDVNDDGYDDLIVGAPYYPDTADRRGQVCVYLGSPTGLSPLASTPDTADWIIENLDLTAVAGLSVSSAGDVNGDGCADIIVGAPGFDVSAQGGEGKALLYHGAVGVPVELSNFTIE